MESVHGSLRRESLVRPQEGRLLGGVCAGLGRRFGIDPWPARLLFVLILLAIPGSQLLLYPILWILMPNGQPNAPVRPVGQPFAAPVSTDGSLVPVVPTAAAAVPVAEGTLLPAPPAGPPAVDPDPRFTR
ncbi:MAG TPA: PspC domain-containing protein [Catenuloplanes sp.]|jgi:phage shock protein PspC (stress-responsive transcriptional regulator)